MGTCTKQCVLLAMLQHDPSPHWPLEKRSNVASPLLEHAPPPDVDTLWPESASLEPNVVDDAPSGRLWLACVKIHQGLLWEATFE